SDRQHRRRKRRREGFVPRCAAGVGRGRTAPVAVHPLAGKPAPRDLLVNVPRLVAAYYTRRPDVNDPAERVAFGTSGHRGSSFAILTYNRGRTSALADGVVITPSHNPPEDGGIKYNPPAGGPADTETTKAIEERANALLADQGAPLRVGFERAMRAATTHRHDYVRPYVDDL